MLHRRPARAHDTGYPTRKGLLAGLGAGVLGAVLLTGCGETSVKEGPEGATGASAKPQPVRPPGRIMPPAGKAGPEAPARGDVSPAVPPPGEPPAVAPATEPGGKPMPPARPEVEPEGDVIAPQPVEPAPARKAGEVVAPRPVAPPAAGVQPVEPEAKAAVPAPGVPVDAEGNPVRVRPEVLVLGDIDVVEE